MNFPCHPPFPLQIDHKSALWAGNRDHGCPSRKLWAISPAQGFLSMDGQVPRQTLWLVEKVKPGWHIDEGTLSAVKRPRALLRLEHCLNLKSRNRVPTLGGLWLSQGKGHLIFGRGSEAATLYVAGFCSLFCNLVSNLCCYLFYVYNSVDAGLQHRAWLLLAVFETLL